MTARTTERSRILVDLAAAVLLLTRFPVRWERFSSEAPDHGRSVWAAPVVGLLIGGVGAVVLLLVHAGGVPLLPAVLAALSAQALATGAFHEDGLADVFDGFGGGRTREAKLEIMKDSRIGTFGTLALLLSVGLRASALATLSPESAALAFLAAGAASRSAIAGVLRVLPSARPGGLGAVLREPTAGELGAAVVLGSIPGVASFGWGTFLTAFGVGALAVGVLAVIARRQVGGYTGDVLGAAQQIGEMSFLLALSASRPG